MAAGRKTHVNGRLILIATLMNVRGEVDPAAAATPSTRLLLG
jgi:hypothetical protein